MAHETPWHVSTNHDDCIIAVNKVVARTLGNAGRAAKIVRCVNAHDDMVAALERIARMPDNMIDTAREVARAALAKAKGE